VIVRPTGVMAGIALTVLAYFLFAFQDATIKWLVAELPVWQIMFCRSVAIVGACLTLGRGTLLRRVAVTPHKRALAIRSAVTMVAWLCYYSAAAHLQLAQMLTLYFAAPIIVTVLAIPMLGERVTPVRWLGVAIGFCGVAVAGDPFGTRIGWPALLVLTAASLWAVGVILMRRIGRQETSLLQLFTTNLGFLVVTGMACLVSWHPAAWRQNLLLGGLGVFGGLGQFCLFEGARMAPASVTSTFEYTALVWAFIFGYLIWHDIPSVPVVLGAALILAAGLLLVLSERAAQSRAAGVTPTS
jgi:drug/metabolite transporter (DMT)-like permease